MALRRVSDGGVTVAEGGYVHRGQPVAGALAAALERLHTVGCLAVGAPGPSGYRPVEVTVAGAVQLGELDRGPRHG